MDSVGRGFIFGPSLVYVLNDVRRLAVKISSQKKEMDNILHLSAVPTSPLQSLIAQLSTAILTFLMLDLGLDGPVKMPSYSLRGGTNTNHARP